MFIINQPNHNWITLIVLFVVIMLSSCDIPSPDPPSEAAIHVDLFPNILNLKGVPDSARDRSVFAFSDLGAWHAYALPSPKDKTLAGSFVGPFIMTQDNGVWLSQCLSKMQIIDRKTERILNLTNAQITESNSYPNRLQQTIETESPALRIQTNLIFVSNRTALIKLTILNKSEAALSLAVKWSGNSFLEELSFSKHPKGILIDFGKNENIGWISTDAPNYTTYTTNDQNYSIQQDKAIKPKESWDTYLSQTFCFSETERKKEQTKLEQIFNDNSALVFQQNRKRWDQYIQQITDQLKKPFRTKSHQRIAVKCLQTLNNNWRSAAGFLEHDGLFPSYNYEWFNGFWSWDSWKHAVALARYDTQLAQNQIRAMYDFQDEMGMIADCVYRDTIIENHNWRDTKPPLSAWAVWEVYQKSKDEDFLLELLPKVEKYHNWWYLYRDIDQNGLCEYGATDASLTAAKWESGMDNAVRFDDTDMIKNGLKGGSMNRESVDLNAYLFAEKRYLANIFKALGQAEKANEYLSQSDTLQQKIHQLFYDEESAWYYDIDLHSKKQFKVFGAEGWIPLWSTLASPEQAAQMKKSMTDSSKFATFIPFPTLAANHPKFKPDGGYWRGPVWLDQAYFAIQGLKNYGYDEEAIQFSHHLFDRLEGLRDNDLPIRENYHPLTGEGQESYHFSWSAAHLLMLLTDCCTMY